MRGQCLLYLDEFLPQRFMTDENLGGSHLLPLSTVGTKAWSWSLSHPFITFPFETQTCTQISLLSLSLLSLRLGHTLQSLQHDHALSSVTISPAPFFHSYHLMETKRTSSFPPEKFSLSKWCHVVDPSPQSWSVSKSWGLDLPPTPTHFYYLDCCRHFSVHFLLSTLVLQHSSGGSY